MHSKTLAAAVGGFTTRLFVVVLAMAAWPGSASAAAVFGSAAWLTARDCSNIANNVDCVGANAPRTVNQFLGGVGTSLDSTTAGADGTWVIKSGANPGGLPVLKAGTWSGQHSRINTNTVVFQQFTFTGPAHTKFSMVGDLTYAFSGNDGLDGSGIHSVGNDGEQAGEAGIYATMYFMDPAAFIGVSTARDVMALLTQDCTSPFMHAQATFNSNDAPGAVAAGSYGHQLKIDKSCNGSDIFLDPGVSTILVLALQTPSNRGGYSDATHTFISNFDPTLPQATLDVLRSNFIPASPADVPEPASLALAGLALLALVVARTRHGGPGLATLRMPQSQRRARGLPRA